MTKIYRKTATIKAEQFDGTKQNADQLGLFKYRGSWYLETLEGSMLVTNGYWIATGANGEHWPISDDVFKKTYAELPVIPKVASDWIEKCKHDGTSVGDMLCSERRPEKMRDWMALTPGTYEFNQRRYKEHQELVACAWIDGYTVED